MIVLVSAYIGMHVLHFNAVVISACQACCAQIWYAIVVIIQLPCNLFTRHHADCRRRHFLYFHGPFASEGGGRDLLEKCPNADSRGGHARDVQRFPTGTPLELLDPKTITLELKSRLDAGELDFLQRYKQKLDDGNISITGCSSRSCSYLEQWNCLDVCESTRASSVKTIGVSLLSIDVYRVVYGVVRLKLFHFLHYTRVNRRATAHGPGASDSSRTVCSLSIL